MCRANQMNRILKTFLLWLMMAALPVQGMAAVLKVSCSPRHHDLRSVMPKVVEHHHDSDTAPHQHELIDNTDADGRKLAHSANDVQSSKHDHETSYCSACAACCVGAAAPSSTFSLASLLINGEAVASPRLVSFTGFIPASLERPPR